MLFVASELWPLFAAATWIALGVFITWAAIAGRKRGGAREGAESRWARPRTAHGSGPVFAGPTGISVHRRMGPGGAGQDIRVRPARRFERRPALGVRNWTLLVLVAVFSGSSIVAASPVEWSVASGGNGHWYDFLGNQLAGNPNTYSWDEARLDAEARGGYLATPTSAAEWAFMQSQMYDWVGPVDPVYSTCGACGNRSYQGWLGAFQNTSSPSYSEPGGGWEWVTGESWSFTAWSGGEPNNLGGEDHMMTWFHNAAGWNDHVPTTVRYFIEYDTNPIPEPNTALLLGFGLVGLAMRRPQIFSNALWASNEVGPSLGRVL